MPWPTKRRCWLRARLWRRMELADARNLCRTSLAEGARNELHCCRELEAVTCAVAEPDAGRGMTRTPAQDLTDTK